MGRVLRKKEDIIPGQMTIQECIDWIENLEEFAKYMNKPERENGSAQKSEGIFRGLQHFSEAEQTKGELRWRN